MAKVEYEDRVAVITGASSGIGEQMAVDLARRGVTLCLIARRKDRLEQTLQRVQEHSPKSSMIVGSVGDRETCERLIAEALSAHGGSDFLINNAGIMRHRDVAELTAEDAESVMQINFLGTVYPTLAVLPHMIDRGEGWIINMGSGTSHMALPLEAIYAASKHAIRGWSEGLWLDLKARGISVSVIHPGPIDTEMVEGIAATGEPSRLTDGSTKLYPPQVVSDALFRVIEGRQFEVSAPPRYGFVYWLHGVMPGALRRGIFWDAQRAARSDRALRGAAGGSS